MAEEADTTSTVELPNKSPEENVEDPETVNVEDPETEVTAPEKSPKTTEGVYPENSKQYTDEEMEDVDLEALRSLVSPLDPPRSWREAHRDWWLQLLDRPIFQTIGIIVFVAVIADGATFFFFLMGWHTVCDTPSKTDCQPRNNIYNLTVQILTWLFTYMALVSLPWRCANATHIFGWGTPRRDNTPGHDLYGRPTNEIWFHYGWWNRFGIIIALLLNCFCQFANQITRLIFITYEEQYEHPGDKWVSVFFGASMVMAAVGAIWTGIVNARVRKKHPGRFGPGAQDMVMHYVCVIVTCRWCKCRRKEEQEEGGSTSIADIAEQQRRKLEELYDQHDPTRYSKRDNILGGFRATLRLFGM